MSQEAKEHFVKAMIKEAVAELIAVLTQFISTKLVPFESQQTFNEHFQEYLSSNDFSFDFFLLLFKFVSI